MTAEKSKPEAAKRGAGERRGEADMRAESAGSSQVVGLRARWR